MMAEEHRLESEESRCLVPSERYSYLKRCHEDCSKCPYDKDHEQCKTPALSEDEIKEKFVKAYNLVMVNKDAVIEDIEEVIKLLADTSELDNKIEDLQSKMEVISGLVEKLVRDNARTAQDQMEYAKKYDGLKNQYDAHKESLERALEDRTCKQAKEVMMKAYLADMRNADNYLPEWSDDVWMTMVEKATVNRNKTITFQFTSGKEITL